MNLKISNEKIAIVLATYHPKLTFFIKQLDSIKQQDFTHWVCHIVDDHSQFAFQEEIQRLAADDARFICHFHEKNVNSFHNFERGLQYCLEDDAITAIAFADQDDIWHSEKLSVLLKTMRASGSLLIHSDLEMINEQDQIIHPSCWDFEGRNPEKSTFELLLLRNMVTGCSLLFCASLLKKVLPFPAQEKVGWHHDHWVALVAAKLGKITHLRQPLISYRMHANNVIGAIKDPGQVTKEFKAWAKNGFRITGGSYLYHSQMSQVLYKRFDPTGKNPFDNQSLNFGLRMIKLGWQCYQSGNGSVGIALRLCVLKFLLDVQRVFRSKPSCSTQPFD